VSCVWQARSGTQVMSPAVAMNGLREPAGAEDALQEAYLRAYWAPAEFRRPGRLPRSLRRVVIMVALNLLRAHRTSLRLGSLRGFWVQVSGIVGIEAHED